MATEIANLSSNSSGVIVVDPKINSVVAVGYDETSDGSVRHAVMVAIDNVAKSQRGGAWNTSEDLGSQTDENFTLCGIPKNILGKLKEKFRDTSFGASVFTPKNGDPEGPYLCTGYEVYTVKEPCVMCAMALIHSRAKRVFYRTPSAKGALGSLCKIHTIKDLNHHYEVFMVTTNDERGVM
ncbi:probable inactive tRNA-specific adenosine deaminase-like protein 3 [Coccinella septempunctata]|uniref:probable inactive tRNA-specific adenosine deaminase-like protein 3 n=1 Tax=Coccinella septempunctata TaxID=41139 RepID=UPI001D0799A9|nr:probable inactive tRNA-specific adenosine deaminase-like protein 3 [Coccinella septempunctata]